MTCDRDLGYTCSANPGLRDPGCGEHFGSLRAFDRHLVGTERRCMTRATMKRAGLRLNNRGAWTEAEPMTEGRQLAFGAKRGGTQTRRSIKRVATRRPKHPQGRRGDRGKNLGPTSQEISA